MKACPRCGSPMDEVAFGSVRVDGCGGCGGVWFDQGELATLAQTQAAHLGELESQFEPHLAEGQRHGSMECPNCHVKLSEFEFKYLPGIRLDGCPQCKGIWLDEGETEAVQKRIQQGKPQPGTPTAGRPDPRRTARQAAGFLVSAPCPGCGQPNPTTAPTCWACGIILQGKRGFLCPRCDRPLAGAVREGVRLDSCPTCRGLWLDAAELPALIRRGPDGMHAIEQALAAEHPAGRRPVETRLDLMCPICHLVLEQHQYAYGSGIRINRCSRCQGTWMDAGDLGRIADFIVGGEGYPGAPGTG